MAGDTGDIESGWYEETEEDLDDTLEGSWVSAPATAGGGSSKDSCKEENREPSLLLISVEEAGVGGF